MTYCWDLDIIYTNPWCGYFWYNWMDYLFLLWFNHLE